MRGLLMIVAATAALAIGAPDQAMPARYLSGGVPDVPVQATGAGQVFIELAVSDAGAVVGVKPLRSTPPFTEAVAAAVQGWRFIPARDTDDPKKPLEAVASMVLVAAVFRPPTLLNGPVAGDPPKEVGAASPATPFPGSVVVPAFPPKALASGLVMVEVDVDPSGAVTDARVLVSASGLDDAALDAARKWTFRPARLHGRAASAEAYLIFAFRQPVT